MLRLILIVTCLKVIFGFDTEFDCREGPFPKEFIDSAKDFALESANFFDDQKSESLDLSTVGLGFVEEDFFSRSYTFKSFNLSRNNVRTLQLPYWRHFRMVTKLDLSNNCITTIDLPDREVILTRLVSLNLQNNLIKHIHPFAFSNLTELQEINLSHNKLARFLAASFSAGKIYLNNNRISQIVIDSEETNRKTVSVFDARNNSIIIFQVALGIDNLLLAHNRIQINEYFSIQYVYEVLDLSYNHISNFNWEMFSMTSHVILANNHIKQVNETCTDKKYVRVKKLDLSGNFIKILRYRMLLYCMPNLSSISLLGNDIDVQILKKAKHLFDVNNIQSVVFRNETNIFFTNES